jgi:predicted GTPase
MGQVTILDTPGLDTFDEEVPYIQQVIKHSDVILFVVDGRIGMESKEQHIHQLILQSEKIADTILILNKMEKAYNTNTLEVAIAEYRGLGTADIVPVVANQ